MSPQCRNSGLFSKFMQHARQVTSNELFQNHFNKSSCNGDRHEMIKILLEALGPSTITIDEFYRAKNESQALELLQKAISQKSSAINAEKTVEILSEALLCSPPRSKLFFEILAERIRAWYCAGNLSKCSKDCQYFTDSIANVKDDAFAEESRIDVLLLHSDCSKLMNKIGDAKNHLNEAMRRINELARKRCGNEDERSEIFKIKKVELLKSFLQRKQELPTPQKFEAILHLETKQIPAVEGKVNEFLSNCSDAVALGYDDIRGRYLYATRNIKAGSVLIVDRPFSFSTDIAALHRNCLYCHRSLKLNNIRIPCESCQTVQFCSEECRHEAWKKFHKYECKIFDYFYEKNLQETSSLLTYRTVVIAALLNEENMLEINKEFLQLHKNDKDIFNINALRTYESQDYKTVFNLETHCSHAEPKYNLERAIHSVFLAKCLIYSLNCLFPEISNYEQHLHTFTVALLHNMQAINCNAYEIVENIRDDKTKILEPQNVGGAIYTSVSLTNHSCYPNIVRHSFPCGIVVVQSLRFIPKGSEILDCYGQHFLEKKTDVRRKMLAQKYYFTCQCNACLFNWPAALPSNQFDFKCKKCFKQCRKTRNITECIACDQKIEIRKLYTLLQNSIKKRLSALTKMYDGHYEDALPLLLEHAHCIDKILSEPSLEALKTQQSIIQCLNAMSATSI